MTFEVNLEAEVGTCWWGWGEAGEEEKGSRAALYSLSHGHVKSHNPCGKDKRSQEGRIILCREVWGAGDEAEMEGRGQDGKERPCQPG